MPAQMRPCALFSLVPGEKVGFPQFSTVHPAEVLEARGERNTLLVAYWALPFDDDKKPAQRRDYHCHVDSSGGQPQFHLLWLQALAFVSA